jgi:DNA-binding SARP family transcriptional activator
MVESVTVDVVESRNLSKAVRLELLDGFRLEVHGARVNTLTSAQRLLAYLALRGRVARVVVAGTLWANSPEEHALGSLRTAMWRCNRAVQGVVAVERAQIALADFVRVDVAELVDSAAHLLNGHSGGGNGLMPSLRRGELLPGWYEDWVIFERERLRHLRLHALEEGARQLAEAGQYAASLELALEAVRLEPLRESAHHAIIRTHLAENNAVEALRHYERFRELLMDELGIEPSEDLTGLVFDKTPVRPRGLLGPRQATTS